MSSGAACAGVGLVVFVLGVLLILIFFWLEE